VASGKIPSQLVEAANSGVFGQLCGDVSSTAVCKVKGEAATAQTPGYLSCDGSYDCCLCSSVQCGDAISGCHTLSVGDSGVYGVKYVNVKGAATGAQIQCNGVEACAESVITATSAVLVNAQRAMSLRGATLTVTDPVNGFSLDCLGMASCQDLTIEIVVFGPPAGFECNPANTADLVLGSINCFGQESCKNMHLTLRNDGCNSVDVQSIGCNGAGTCDGATFDLVGSVNIAQCDFKDGLVPSGQGLAEQCNVVAAV